MPHPFPHLQGKALSMTEQFSLPNSQYMISTMAAMGFYSKPLLDVCCSRIRGEDQRGRMMTLTILYHWLTFYMLPD